MTTAAEDLQKALARSWAAWGSFARASRTTALELYAAVAEWADEEDVPLKVGSARVGITPTRHIVLTPRLYGRDDPQKTPIDPKLVELDPPELDVPADGSPAVGVRVTVTVRVPAEEAAVAYKGVLLDQDGTVVEDTVLVPMLK